MSKTSYKILVLTDHAKHSAENSLYALLRCLQAHPRCAQLDAASRSVSENDPFFQEQASTRLHVRPIGASFAYDDAGAQFQSQGCTADLLDYDLIFLRLPRPVEDSFLRWLAEVAREKAIVNHPRGILQTSTKAFLLNFPDVCPPMKLVRSVAEIEAFAAQFPIVLKPLQEYGGKGLLKIDGNRVDDGDQQYEAASYWPHLSPQLEEQGYLAMKFLKNVSAGDKRIIVVNGQIMAASLRMPAPDSWLCNVAQGGTSVATEVSPEEEQIIARINPALAEAGVLIYGADTLTGDDGRRVLSEVNTLSIGGFPQAEAQSGRSIIQPTIDSIIHYADAHYGR